MNCAPDRLQIDLYWISSQQIVYIHIAEIADAHSLCDNIAQCRHGAELYCCALAYFHEALHVFGRSGRYRNQQLIDRIGGHQLRKLIDRSEDWDAFDFES